MLPRLAVFALTCFSCLALLLDLLVYGRTFTELKLDYLNFLLDFCQLLGALGYLQLFLQFALSVLELVQDIAQLLDMFFVCPIGLGHK